MAKRTARHFSRKEIWMIASLYASTSLEYSSEFFSREYEISRDTFYMLLEKAVVENIVDEITVNNMQLKAGLNANAKVGEIGRCRSEKHYIKIKNKRKSYILPKDEAIEITTQYANSGYSKKQFCLINFMTNALLCRTIRQAIIQNWVSDDVVERLMSKSLQNYQSESITNFWEKLIQLRNENNKNQG